MIARNLQVKARNLKVFPHRVIPRTCNKKKARKLLASLLGLAPQQTFMHLLVPHYVPVVIL